MSAEDIELELSDSEIKTLISMFVAEQMHVESAGVFQDLLETGTSLEQALLQATINESVIIVLTEEMERRTNER